MALRCARSRDRRGRPAAKIRCRVQRSRDYGRRVGRSTRASTPPHTDRWESSRSGAVSASACAFGYLVGLRDVQPPAAAASSGRDPTCIECAIHAVIMAPLTPAAARMLLITRVFWPSITEEEAVGRLY